MWVELYPLKRYVEVLIPGTCECLPGNRIFADVIKLRWSPNGLGWVPNPITNASITERRRKFT